MKIGAPAKENEEENLFKETQAVLTQFEAS